MPEDGHPSYPNPTIQEAVCEIAFRFQDGVTWNPLWFGQFYDAVKKEFPDLQPFAVPSGFHIQVNPNTPRPKIVEKTTMQVMRYAAVDRPVLLQLSDDRITVNALPPYGGWAQMIEDIGYAWDRVVRVIEPLAITRIGLRYINRFERRSSHETLEKWLVPTEYVPQGILKSFPGAMLSQIQARMDEHNRIHVVVGEQEAGNDAASAFIIDIDRIFEQETSPDRLALLNQTTELHDDVWKVFSDAKGEKLERLLNGELL